MVRTTVVPMPTVRFSSVKSTMSELTTCPTGSGVLVGSGIGVGGIGIATGAGSVGAGSASLTTVTVAIMNGWTEQKYGNDPTSSKVNEKLWS